MSQRRVGVLFFFMALLAFGLMVRTLTVAMTPAYVQAADSQSVYNLTVYSTRGRIYDRHLRSLAGGRKQYRAVIIPSRDTTVRLTGALPPDKLLEIQDSLTGTVPFVCTVDDAAADGKGAIVYPAQKRYGANCVAVHTVGYLGSDGRGASGIERAYDDYLASASGALSVRFTVDATGAGLAGIEPEVTDTTGKSVAGVVLTIDTDIQMLAEQAAKEYMDKGAVVVIEAATGKILASASAPDFEQDDIAGAIERDDGSLVNRATSAYDLGSVFKLVVAAAALESGISAEFMCECTGCVEIGVNKFHCANRNGHGEIGMEEAFARSCNIYFIELARQLGGDTILDYARRFGFGRSIVLANGYKTSAGCLPEADSLDRPAALANFSFGQGELMATPDHVAAMTAAVARGGVYIQPTVLEGIVNDRLEMIAVNERGEGVRIISEETARALTGFMRAAAEYGTAVAGDGDHVDCAAKTGTAETGIYLDGHRVMQAWYTGFFPAENPEYVVTVMVEDGESGGGSAGPVFKYIADRLCG